MPPKPETIDEYLATLTDEKREALEKIRRAIRAAAPRAEECISYGIPAYRLDGRMLVWFAGMKNHCSFFPGGMPLTAFAKELAEYSTSKGTIRFQADAPLPSALVKKLVKARVAENAVKLEAKKKAATKKKATVRKLKAPS